MKVKQWVTLSDEVEVQIDARDIAAALGEAFQRVKDSPGEELATRRDVDVTLEVLDSTTVNEVFGLFGPATSGQTLIVYPQGNSTGKPKLTCAAFIITGRTRSIGYNDVVAVSVTGKASAGFVEGVVREVVVFFAGGVTVNAGEGATGDIFAETDADLGEESVVLPVLFTPSAHAIP